MATPTLDPAALQALEHQLSTAFTHITASRYMSVAGFAVLIHDHFLTFADEVELIWMKPFSLVSILFLFNRYLVPLIVIIDLYDKGGFARNLPDLFCRVWLVLEANLQVVCFGITHFLVALRVRALWGKPFLDRLLLVGGITYFVLTVILTNFAGVESLPTMVWNPELSLCFTNPLPWPYVVWLPALAFEIVVFGFMITKAIHHARRHVTMPVAQILYRDGILYFGIIAACSVFNILAWSVLPSTLILLAKYFSFSFVNTMSSRLVLNLRGLGRERDPGPWSTDPTYAVELYPFRPSTAQTVGSNAKESAAGVQTSKTSTVVAPKSPRGLTRKHSVFGSKDKSRDLKVTDREGTGLRSMTGSLQIQVAVDVDVDGDEGDKTSYSETHRSKDMLCWDSESPV
ncbi:hypothetical protein FRB99_001441 [Tulasnella sp. 403]|nr:hypothetical protein FRB99_001441 [Tulasnella sp. 403]